VLITWKRPNILTIEPLLHGIVPPIHALVIKSKE